MHYRERERERDILSTKAQGNHASVVIRTCRPSASLGNSHIRTVLFPLHAYISHCTCRMCCTSVCARLCLSINSLGRSRSYMVDCKSARHAGHNSWMITERGGQGRFNSIKQNHSFATSSHRAGEGDSERESGLSVLFSIPISVILCISSLWRAAWGVLMLSLTSFHISATKQHRLLETFHTMGIKAKVPQWSKIAESYDKCI